MADLTAIIEALQNLDKPAVAPALATVVMVRGSAYRRPGARMFVYPDGRRTGTVSGGCLEADVADRAREVLQSGAPEYVLYDAYGSNGDVVVELGCGGAVGVLIEPAASQTARASLEYLASLGESRDRGALATVYRSEGREALRSGDRFYSQEDGARSERPSPGPLTDMISAELGLAISASRAYFRTMTAQSSQAEVLFEPILPQIALRICGSGPDALALAQAAKALGWIVDVAGDRLWRSESRLALGSDGSDGSDPSDDHPIDCRTAVVIMTHNYARDLEWLRVAHGSPAFYVGLLGPKHRTLRLVNELEVEYGVLGDGAIARMYGPAGLDIGAETPEEIALSIVAEIQAAANGRDGGPLRARAASIHSV